MLNVAVVIVTVAAKIPLNDQLAAVADPVAARADFETAWVRWNIARAVLSTAALGTMGAGLVRALAE